MSLNTPFGTQTANVTTSLSEQFCEVRKLVPGLNHPSSETGRESSGNTSNSFQGPDGSSVWHMSGSSVE